MLVAPELRKSSIGSCRRGDFWRTVLLSISGEIQSTDTTSLGRIRMVTGMAYGKEASLAYGGPGRPLTGLMLTMEAQGV